MYNYKNFSKFNWLSQVAPWNIKNLKTCFGGPIENFSNLAVPGRWIKYKEFKDFWFWEIIKNFSNFFFLVTAIFFFFKFFYFAGPVPSISQYIIQSTPKTNHDAKQPYKKWSSQTIRLFLRYFMLKSQAIWLSKTILWLFLDMWFS